VDADFQGTVDEVVQARSFAAAVAFEKRAQDVGTFDAEGGKVEVEHLGDARCHVLVNGPVVDTLGKVARIVSLELCLRCIDDGACGTTRKRSVSMKFAHETEKGWMD